MSNRDSVQKAPRSSAKLSILLIPDHVARFLAPSTSSRAEISKTYASIRSPGTPSSAPFSHKQPWLRAVWSTPTMRASMKREAMAQIMDLIQTHFGSLGNFLLDLFVNVPKDDPNPDPRPPIQALMVKRFLQGHSSHKPAEMVQAVYSSTPKTLKDDKFCKICTSLGKTNPTYKHQFHTLSSWAVVKVGEEARRQIGKLTESNTSSPFATCIQLSSNARRQATVPLIDAAQIFALRIRDLSQYFKAEAKLPWFLLESMTAPYKNKLPMICKRHPHPQIITATISSFVLGRNRYANGYMAVAFGIWMFSCHSHIDVKRISCHIGMSISDSAV
ncbi:hypothetical protein C8J56DRAFT_1039290 [Mycena floridula]|nr:hypothetical protein C8J56DRAFT_1039290 [Mycena floridula]